MFKVSVAPNKGHSYLRWLISWYPTAASRHLQLENEAIWLVNDRDKSWSLTAYSESEKKMFFITRDPAQ